MLYDYVLDVHQGAVRDAAFAPALGLGHMHAAHVTANAGHASKLARGPREPWRMGSDGKTIQHKHSAAHVEGTAVGGLGQGV
jgi:hypothetical protein